MHKEVAIYKLGEPLNRICRAFTRKIQQNNRVDAQTAFEAALCQRYVVGAMDAIATEELTVSRASEDLSVCVPRALNADTATEIVAKYSIRRRHGGAPIVRGEIAPNS